MHAEVVKTTKDMARQLLAFEADHGSDAVVRVCDKLQIHLSSLVGVMGFRTLLQRALVLSRTEFGPLGNFTVAEDGALHGFDEFAGQLSARQIEQGGEALVGHLLMLLETFIGDALTRHLLEDIWPIAESNAKPQKQKKP
jgi:hypothetical protein